jgi:GxxExxY protein
MGKMIHEQLSAAIIGIAMEVLNELNPGLNEVLYERAMVIELRRKRELDRGLHGLLGWGR